MNENESQSTPEKPIPPHSSLISEPSTTTNDSSELKKLRALMAGLDRSQARIEFSIDGIIEDANSNFLKVLGYELDEIKGKHHRMFVDEDFANSEEYVRFWDNLKAGMYQSAEYKRIGKGGKIVWIQASYNPILDESGVVTRVVKYATDITEEVNRKLMMSGLMDGIDKSQARIEFTMDGIIQDANENFLKVMGYTLDEIKGKHHRIFVEPEYADSIAYQNFWNDLNSGTFQTAEYKRIGKGGRIVWIQATYSPVVDDRGIPIRVVKLATDVTESVEKNIINERYFGMTENAPVACILANPDLDMIYMNPAAKEVMTKLQKYLPVAVDDMVGKSIDIFHKNPEKQRSMLKDYKRTLPHTTTIEIGDEVSALQVSAIYDSKGEYLGPMLNWTLITERVRAEEREKEMLESSRKTLVQVQESSDKLSQRAIELAATASQMTDNSRETNEQSESAASAAEQVSTNVSTLATSAEEMRASVQEISRNASDASKIAKEAVVRAEETNEAIMKLGESSAEIGKVIKVITSIAQQTNLLALNATIEAARAGDAGKGFAVVASEVKELAKQTAAATEDISQKIQMIQSDTDISVEKIKEIGQTIAKINDNQNTIASAVEEQAATTNEIARNSNEAAKGSEDIARNIARVSKAASSTSEGATSTLDAARDLEKLSAQLAEIASS